MTPHEKQVGIVLDRDVWRDMRIAAAEEDMGLSKLIERVLRGWLLKRPQVQAPIESAVEAPDQDEQERRAA